MFPFIIAAFISLFPPEESFLPRAMKKDPGNLHGLISGTGDYCGYKDIIYYCGQYLAVGTGGRIDYISSSGIKTAVANSDGNDLNCVAGKDKVLVIGGDKGTILFSSDGRVFSRTGSGTNCDINGIIFTNDLFVAVADRGTILVSQNGNSWSSVKPECRGNIVSITANNSFFICVTDRGEIIRSKDGFNWDIKDYNKEYSGYNRPCVFKKVLASNNRIFIIGKHDDNSPAVLFSTLGNVWTERILSYDDEQNMISYLRNDPNDITYDQNRDQFIVACDNGEIFSLPACTKCNKSAVISASDLYAINCTGDLLITVGRDFSVRILNL